MANQQDAPKRLSKSTEPEFQLQREMEAEFVGNYSSMLFNMGKTLITGVKQNLKRNARLITKSSGAKAI